MNTRHKNHDAIVALAEGKAIECRISAVWREWNDMNYFNPLTTLDMEWRVKPELKPDVVRYFCINHNGTSFGPFLVQQLSAERQIKATFDGESDELKAVEIVK